METKDSEMRRLNDIILNYQSKVDKLTTEYDERLNHTIEKRMMKYNEDIINLESKSKIEKNINHDLNNQIIYLTNQLNKFRSEIQDLALDNKENDKKLTRFSFMEKEFYSKFE